MIALALYMQSSYREVLRCLLEAIQWLRAPASAVKVAGKSGISQARSRLGWEPLKRLFEAVVAPIATRDTKGAWYRRWRLVTLDGSTLDVADTVEEETCIRWYLRARRVRPLYRVKYVRFHHGENC